MNDQQRTNRNVSSGVIAAVSAAVVAVSGGVAWLTSQTPEIPTPGNPSQSIRQPQQPLTTQPGNEQTANIYWLKPTEKSFELVPQPIKIAAAQPNQALEAAFQTLLAGPTEGTDSTTIPQGTKLLGMKVENNEVHVNLSADFTSGGGSSSMVGRVGQVVYTATTLNPNAKVYIEVNGKPLEVLGGEGVEIEQPLTRTSFNKNYPL
ncbi:GerMN domain-containing protein [Anabaena sp. UHCC 0451]|uniref:GerMN domain-containing protein n=1 Tax=Anabaena sp. UHCC 0451 TaxID=2055235 RepID=UPI002B204365|nr:GerMN domain-containing protein [Anabaena sp. UHCC 0451]MEA5575779.1 GerMN domain-containing protein [Anabaena sp. UHCC 0451]